MSIFMSILYIYILYNHIFIYNYIFTYTYIFIYIYMSIVCMRGPKIHGGQISDVWNNPFGSFGVNVGLTHNNDMNGINMKYEWKLNGSYTLKRT